MTKLTKEFPVNVVMIGVRDVLLCPMASVYDLLNWVTQSDGLSTHQLSRAWRVANPFFLSWFPELATDEIDKEIDRFVAVVSHMKGQEGFDAAVRFFAEGVKQGKWQAYYDVPQLPPGVYEHRNSLSELTEMMGADRVIKVVVP